jgi:hypothetical protein
MAAFLSLVAWLSADHSRMVETVAGMRARMTTTQLSWTFLITATSKPNPLSSLVNVDCLTVSGAGNWQSSFQIELTMISHVTNDRLPEGFADKRLTLFLSLRVCQRHCVAENIQTSAGSRQCNDETILVLEESNGHVFVTSDQ